MRRSIFRATFLVLCLGRVIGAQLIRGRVVSADGRTPQQGVRVIVISANADTVGRTVSVGDGAYELSLSVSGTYLLRILRVGYQPQFESVEVRGETIHDIVLVDASIQLDTVRTIASNGCRPPKVGSLVPSDLFEAARRRANATANTQSDNTTIRVALITGSAARDGKSVVLDSTTVREAIVSRVFGGLSADSATALGYVRIDTTGRVTYGMPTVSELLSDSFIGTHCFEVVSSADSLIRVRFQPLATREEIADVAGSLWFERLSGELHRLEFTYSTLPSVALAAFLCGDVASSTHCMSNSTRGLGSGGTAEFGRLSTGEWLTIKWFVVTPPESLRYTQATTGEHKVAGISETCTRGKDCIRPFGPSVRLVVESGRVLDVERSGTPLYVDSSAQSQLSKLLRRNVGGHYSGVRGVVTGRTNAPLIGAIVETIAPMRATTTRDDGSFEIGLLPAKPTRLRVQCAGYRGVVLPLPLLADSVRTVRIGLVPLDSIRRDRDLKRGCIAN